MRTTPFNLFLVMAGWLLSAVPLLAQAPQAINYQAVAQNAAGDPLANQNIVVRLGVYQGNTPTTLVYEEQHELTTTATGLFTLAIGEGTASTGAFTDISWGSDTHHLSVELDAGDGFIDLGTVPLLSVPYALYAENSGSDGSAFALPFDGSIATEGQIGFRVANTNPGDGLALLGVQGGGSDLGDITQAAIWGSAETGYGVVGFSSGESGRAGIWGGSNQAAGYGVYGSASGGGVGGLFETSGDEPGAALITRGGSVGIGTENPEKLLHVEGDLFVNTSQGNLELGIPANGNQWRISTPNEGQILQFLSKADSEETFTPRVSLGQTGLIGIGTDAPEKLLHVEGDLFVNSAEGAIDFGYPDNGHQWHLSTLNGGEDLQFFSKEEGSTTNVRRMILKQNGQVGIGDLTSPTGQVEIASNSAVSSAHLTLTESEDDFARLTFRNTESTNTFWAIAGYNTSPTNNELLNVYHSTTGDIMTFRGDGNVGVRETNPTARFHIGQNGQTVGRGLRIDDGINEVWDITHGFGLRLHYGGELRGFFNATTGAYTQSSDGRMKRDAENLNQVLPQLKQLHPLAYRYRNARTSEKTIGFVAQEVKPLFPELVHYSEVDDIYGIDYAGFSVVAIKAIQEQQTVIEAQQQTIDGLLQRLEVLERKIALMPNQ